MAKVYLIVVSPDEGGGTSDAYYVRADNHMLAEEKLSTALKQFWFKVKLAADPCGKQPKTIGDDVIVEGIITEEFLTLKRRITDVTDLAYLWNLEGQDIWREWNITLEDLNA